MAILTEMAERMELSPSDFAKRILLDRLEDEIDLDHYRKAMAHHKLKDESVSHAELKQSLGL